MGARQPLFVDLRWVRTKNQTIVYRHPRFHRLQWPWGRLQGCVEFPKDDCMAKHVSPAWKKVVRAEKGCGSRLFVSSLYQPRATALAIRRGMKALRKKRRSRMGGNLAVAGPNRLGCKRADLLPYKPYSGLWEFGCSVFPSVEAIQAIHADWRWLATTGSGDAAP